MNARSLIRACFGLATTLALVGCHDQAPDVMAPDVDVLQARGGQGKGGGEGGSGGGNGNGNGSARGGDKKGDMYAELVFVLRSVDGLPLLRTIGEESCLQPISYAAIPDVEPTTNPVDGQDVWLVPLVGDLPTVTFAVAAEDETEVEVCDPQADYVDYVDEVPFGRLNLGRSPDKVLDRALLEVEFKLRFATEILLDHAGRLTPDGVVVDAPAENLAVHRELQLHGAIDDYVLPQPQGYSGYLDHAASGLGGAADKFGKISPDLVVYNNRILNLPNEVTVGGLGTLVGDGMVGEEGEKYLDYGGYSYTRSETFPGCIVGYHLDGDVLVPFSGTIMAQVFGGDDFTGSNLNGFAQRADDARAVIYFEHESVVVAVDRIGESSVCTAYDLP